MSLQTYNCHFILYSDLIKDTSEDFQEELSDRIGDSVTWGDADRTLIDRDKILVALNDVYDEYDLDHKYSDLIYNRLSEMNVNYVDMEN